ncbi:MAG: hypothetical protein CSB24_04585 [Deltaproteobacteria bacterium]|nr:MAG: hypothetical protein CSB24_04585 [Deltaproteobacteria bacterium]
MDLFKSILAALLCLFCLASSGCTAGLTAGDEEENEKRDDWAFEQNKEDLKDRLALTAAPSLGIKAGASLNLSAPSPATMYKSAAAAPRQLKRKLGFAVGGAKDTGNFRQNIKENFLPKYHSITYEGLFYEYYFDTGIGQGSCDELFCPSYTRAVTPDLFSGEADYYLSVGLNSGLTEESFSRKKLNLVVVVDISGSMGSSFDEYYYDRANSASDQEKAGKSKMQLANETIVAMMQHLQDDDRFGVVLFDDTAYTAKPLRLVKYTDMKAIAGHIKDIRENGGTNWQAGYEKGVDLYSSLEGSLMNQAEYENRIIFLTDAMPNLGELSEDGLFAMVRKAAEKGIYTSFIGVGVDFNPELVEYVTKTRGANYFSVHNAKEFKKTLADEFDLMVTPLLFDLELTVQSDEYAIEGVFGSPEANLATGQVMQIKTLFPSPAEDEQVKGGVVLVKLHKKSNASGGTPIELSVSYRDRNGTEHTAKDTVSFADMKKPSYDNLGIRKAILLADYVSLLKNWLLDQNKGCNDQVEVPVAPFFRDGLPNPDKRPMQKMISRWEKKSCPFAVSAGYQKLFTLFLHHFQEEAAVIDDKELSREKEILEKLTAKKSFKQPPAAKDDWQGKQ